MKTIDHYLMRRALAILTTGLALGGIFGTTSRADMYRIGSLNSGGGVPAQSTITSMTTTSTNTTISWYGMQGWYSVEATTNIATSPWTSLGATAASDFAWSLTVTNPDPVNAQFRLNQANSYAGQGNCGSCHGDKFSEWSQTPHATALSLLAAIHQDNNASCLPCHTVGFGQPTGYTNMTLTPQLANVGCENCHGPAGWHKNSDHSLIRPAVSIDPEICGSCHQGSHHPTYTEYEETKHAQVNLDIKYGNAAATQYYTNTVVVLVKGVPTTYYGYFITTNSSGTLVTNATTGIINSSHAPGSPVDPGNDRSTSCGVCHSAATRMAMLSDYADRLAGGPVKPLDLPSANDAAAWTAACATCHDPHSTRTTPIFTYRTSPTTNMVPVTPREVQLRNPLWSSNYYTMASLSDKRNTYSTNFNGAITTNVIYNNTTFASMYNPDVQVCGQCHNTRGARWDGLAYGLITNTVVGGPVTNVVYTDVYTWVTNIQVFTNSIPYVTNTYIYSYVSGRAATNVVVASVTNKSIITGLTTNVTGYSRPPHHSVQYNVLIGIVQPDYLNTIDGKTVNTNGLGNGMGIYAAHSGIAPRSVYNTNQCATCHVPNYAVDANNTVTGHTYEMDTHNCILCHGSLPSWPVTQINTTNTIASLASLLNYWATDKAPAILGATDYNKSKQNSWEFTTPGALGSITNAGPAATNQVKLPAAILQARFNAYMVLNDGSMGVHNPTFIPLLLSDAENKVLSQYPVAGFKARTATVGFPGLKVAFTNLGVGLTSVSWNFGDGNTSTSANPTNTYASAGVYAVTLTATGPSGTETLVHSNYINVVTAPTVGFTATPTTGPKPLTVNFTNTSANAIFYRWQLLTGPNLYSNDTNPVFTFTNAGTYKVILRASNAGGNVTATNTITVN